MEAGVTSGSTALATDVHKHNSNNAKCSKLGWACIPIEVETWPDAGVQTSCYLSIVTLMRANSRALLAVSIMQDHLWKIHRTYLDCNISPFVCIVYV